MEGRVLHQDICVLAITVGWCAASLAVTIAMLTHDAPLDLSV